MLLGAQAASLMREAIIETLSRHAGALIVLDGALSDEIPAYGRFADAIDLRIQAHPLSRRVHACDDVPPHPEHVLPGLLDRLGIPLSAEITVTGAWYYPDQSSGCVNGVIEILKARGYSPSVSKCALKPAASDNESPADRSATPKIRASRSPCR